jgi:Flp pilus assembly protein TadD
LKTALKELNDRKARREMAKIETMADELATLKARIEVLEAKKVPYSREELALFSRPATAPAPAPETTAGASQDLPSAARPLIAEAQRDFAARRFQEAERKFEQVLKQNDSHVNTLVNLAAAQIEQAQYRDAEKNLEKALSLSPEDAFALSQFGYLRMRQGKTDDAVDLLGRAAQLDPKNADVQNYLGVALSEKGQRAAAEAALRKAVQLSPGNPDAHHNLAVIYATQNPPLLELARWHYQKARAAGHAVNAELEKKLGGQ